MHSLVRGFLLSWSGSFVDEKEKRLGRLLCYVCYGPFGGSKNRRAFNNCESLDQIIKIFS